MKFERRVWTLSTIILFTFFFKFNANADEAKALEQIPEYKTQETSPSPSLPREHTDKELAECDRLVFDFDSFYNSENSHTSTGEFSAEACTRANEIAVGHCPLFLDELWRINNVVNRCMGQEFESLTHSLTPRIPNGFQ